MHARYTHYYKYTLKHGPVDTHELLQHVFYCNMEPLLNTALDHCSLYCAPSKQLAGYQQLRQDDHRHHCTASCWTHDNV